MTGRDARILSTDPASGREVSVEAIGEAWRFEPTRVDGHDIKPDAERRGDYAHACRLYPTADGLREARWLRFFAPRSAPEGVTMTDLRGIADLKARFNADRGSSRLVVIFSPT
jgi:hypothetical protein